MLQAVGLDSKGARVKEKYQVFLAGGVCPHPGGKRTIVNAAVADAQATQQRVVPG